MNWCHPSSSQDTHHLHPYRGYFTRFWHRNLRLHERKSLLKSIQPEPRTVSTLDISGNLFLVPLLLVFIFRRHHFWRYTQRRTGKSGRYSVNYIITQNVFLRELVDPEKAAASIMAAVRWEKSTVHIPFFFPALVLLSRCVPISTFKIATIVARVNPVTVILIDRDSLKLFEVAIILEF